MEVPKRFMLIACAVLYRECYYCASQSKNIVEVHLCKKGLHDIGSEKMSARLQSEIDAVSADDYDAILLAYGLCNNGTAGLHADIPIVLPRAHDCITLLMGSKEKYREYFEQHPGTYFRSNGWIEQDTSYIGNPESTISQMGIGTYQEYVEKYGEENARYIMDTLGDGLNNYSKLAYIDTNVGNKDHYTRQTKQEAAEKGWDYELIQGNNNLLMQLLDGTWNEDAFLVIEPGTVMKPSHDDVIVKTE